MTHELELDRLRATDGRGLLISAIITSGKETNPTVAQRLRSPTQTHDQSTVLLLDQGWAHDLGTGHHFGRLVARHLAPGATHEAALEPHRFDRLRLHSGNLGDRFDLRPAAA